MEYTTATPNPYATAVPAPDTPAVRVPAPTSSTPGVDKAMTFFSVVFVAAMLILAAIVVYDSVYNFMLSDAGRHLVGDKPLVDLTTYTGTPIDVPQFDVYHPRTPYNPYGN